MIVKIVYRSRRITTRAWAVILTMVVFSCTGHARRHGSGSRACPGAGAGTCCA